MKRVLNLCVLLTIASLILSPAFMLLMNLLLLPHLERCKDRDAQAKLRPYLKRNDSS